MPIHVIVDVSGAMREMGKIHIQRNLCRYLSQVQGIDREGFCGVEFHLFAWAEEVSRIDMEPGGDIPALPPQGRAELPPLAEFLAGLYGAGTAPRALILSDGNMVRSDLPAFKSRMQELGNPMLRTVAIGADADGVLLQQLSSNNTVFLAENISSAVRGMVAGCDKPPAAPGSVFDILAAQPDDTEEDWDA